MHALSVFLAVLPLSLAFPSSSGNLHRSAEPSAWKPAEGSKVACNATSDKIISFVVGPQLETVLNDACAAMLPKCAYPERVPNGTACARSTYWTLDGSKTSNQSANVEDAETTNKLSGWLVKFSVNPPHPPASWAKEDCFGYFDYIVNKPESEGGCLNFKGSGIGNMTVGGNSTLKDTVFDIQIIKRK